MPEAQAAEPKDILYHPGISFRNPGIVRTAAPVRANPWFFERKAVGPLSASSKLRRFEANDDLNRYKAVWNRRAKQRNVERLGAYFEDVPTMNELGEAPPATSTTTNVVRSATGFLDSLLSIGGQVATGVTDIIQNREAQKQAAVRARIDSFVAPVRQVVADNSNTVMIVAGVGILAVGAYFLTRR